MKYTLHADKGRFNGLKISNIRFKKFRPCRHISTITGCYIIQYTHLITTLKQCLNNMRTDKSGPAGYEIEIGHNEIRLAKEKYRDKCTTSRFELRIMNHELWFTRP